MKLNQLNILLADDDIDDCFFFKEALDELLLSTRIIAVHDGEQLMQLLKGEAYQLPHVLFLDINMPRKNGFECLAEIKLSRQLQMLPVIMFSTSFEQEVVSRLYKSGAHYFIRKPCEFAEFKKIIHHALSLIAPEQLTQPTREDFVLAF